MPIEQHTIPQTIAGQPMINGDVMRLSQGGRLLPYIKDTVFCNFGKNYFTTFAEYWMDKDYVPDTEIYHVEENLQIYTIRANAAVTAAGAGAAAVIPYANNVLPGAINIQAGYFVALPPLGKLAKVTAVDVNAKTFTIEPADKLYTITIGAQQDLIIIPASLVAACGCVDIPSSIKTPGMLYKSRMGIIEKQKKICGEDLAKWLESRTLFPLKKMDDSCEDVQVWWHADLDQMWFEFTLAKQMFVMLGEDVSNDSGNWTGLKSTTGVMHILRSRASQEPVALSAGTDYLYWKRLTKKIKRIRNYCTQYGFWQGPNHRSFTNEAFEGKVTKQDISWGFLQSSAERGIEFGFDAAKIDGIEYYFHDEASFGDPGFLGAAGFNGPDTSIGIPLCKVQCGQRGVSTPIVLNYLAGNGINRELIENDYGILRPGSHNSKCDWHEWQLKTQFGIDFYCPNYFIFSEGI